MKLSRVYSKKSSCSSQQGSKCDCPLRVSHILVYINLSCLYIFWVISGIAVNSLYTGCLNIFDQPSELPLSYPASPLNVPPCQYVFSFPKKGRFDPKLTRKRGRRGKGREDSPRVISPPLEFHSAPRCEGSLSPTGLHSWSRKRKGE